jgi:hypothetical protein
MHDGARLIDLRTRGKQLALEFRFVIAEREEGGLAGGEAAALIADITKESGAIATEMSCIVRAAAREFRSRRYRL